MEHGENMCPVCNDRIETFAVGACDHPICYKCSTRMRVLCEHMYCPICRTDLPQVLLVRKLGKFESFRTRGWHSYRKCQTFFEDKSIKTKFFELLDHKCPLCKDRPPDRFLQDLSRHLRRDHERFFCDLCVEHLKIFTHELKHYNRKQLAVHRREGDPDDMSYKGHPLCKFCDVRYLDNDELSRHLRKDHYYCHFCDTDGSNQFYSEYEVLKEHFREEHYLCEEGECIDAQFTHAFRSEIDLKAHKANSHSKGMRRSFTKQARTLEVEFALAPRARPDRNYRDYADGSSRGGRGSRQGRDRYNNRAVEEETQISRAIEASLTDQREVERPPRDRREKKSRVQRHEEPEPVKEIQPMEEFDHSDKNFPSLSGKASPTEEFNGTADSRDASPPSSLAQKLALAQGHTVRTGKPSEEDFPALGNVAANKTAKWVRGRGSILNKDKDFPKLENPVRQVRSAVQSQATSRHHSNIAPTRPQSTVLYTAPETKAQQPVTTQPSHISSINKRDSEEFPGLPTAARPTSAKSQAGVKGPWVSKSTDIQQNAIQSNKNKEKPKPMESETPASGLTLADLGKSLHDGSYLPLQATLAELSEADGVSKEESKDTGVKSKAKKKKKQKAKEESNVEEFSGYPELKKPETTIEKPSVEKLPEPVNDNKENITKKSVKESVKQQRNSEKPWTLTSCDKKPWTMVDSLEDFPSLSGVKADPSPSPKPPPGFSASPPSNPPPGFSSQISPSRPPPGLDRPILTNSTLQANDIMNIANIDIGSVPLLYSKPASFSDRNKNLISDIRSCLNDDGDKFNLFKTWSGDFRQGNLSAKSYYDQCVTLLGRENFSKMFAELLVLLPDIDKQQELLSVHNPEVKHVKKKGWNVNQSEFCSCPVCRQVLVDSDKQEHLSLHKDTDFPSLSRCDSRVGPGLSAWVKAT